MLTLELIEVHQDTRMRETASVPRRRGSSGVVKRKKGRRESYQLPLFQFCQTTETEKLIFYFWDAIKRRNTEQLYDASKRLSQWLSSEQFEAVIQECKQALTIEDKAWFTYISDGYNPSVLSLLFVSHGERRALIDGDSGIALILVLFLIKLVEHYG